MAREPHFVYYHSNRAVPPQRLPGARKRSRKRVYTFASVLLVGFLFAHGISRHVSHAHAQDVTQAAQSQNQVAAEAAVVPKVQAVLDQNEAVTFGVSIVDVQSGRMTNLGSQEPITAASTGKLMTAALYLHLVGTHKASMSQKIDGATASTWLRQMVVLSDNTAWANLNDYLTHSALHTYAESIGIHDYNPDDNLLAPRDTALLLQKLANGSLLPFAQARTLLGFMKIANYRASIVPAVPADDTVYHKIGFLDDYLHDVAIIQNPAGQKVVLCIYTNGHGTYNDDARNAAIQQITQAVIQGYL